MWGKNRFLDRVPVQRLGDLPIEHGQRAVLRHLRRDQAKRNDRPQHHGDPEAGIIGKTTFISISCFFIQ